MAKNVTLRLDEAILRKARHQAVERDQSLSQWVADLIGRSVADQQELSRARERAMRRLQSPLHLGGKPLSRGEAHER